MRTTGRNSTRVGVRIRISTQLRCAPKATASPKLEPRVLVEPGKWLVEHEQAMDGTLIAHVEGGVPNITVQVGRRNAFTLGEMIYFFEYACGLSGYLLDVNPFDQPGVEAYKKNMFALLGKPGYEELGRSLLEKLGR